MLSRITRSRISPLVKHQNFIRIPKIAQGSQIKVNPLTSTDPPSINDVNIPKHKIYELYLEDLLKVNKSTTATMMVAPCCCMLQWYFKFWLYIRYRKYYCCCRNYNIYSKCCCEQYIHDIVKKQ